MLLHVLLLFARLLALCWMSSCGCGLLEEPGEEKCKPWCVCCGCCSTSAFPLVQGCGQLMTGRRWIKPRPHFMTR